MAVARYPSAVKVDVCDVLISVALTPCAVYAVVFVAVKAGTVSNSIEVGPPEDGADEEDVELADDVMEVASDVMEAAEAVEAGEAELVELSAKVGRPPINPVQYMLLEYLATHCLVAVPMAVRLLL